MKRLFQMTGLCTAIFLVVLAPARAQSPSPDTVAAARELVNTMNLIDQFKSVMPILLKGLKPTIVQGRADVDRDYDSLMPILLDGFMSRMGELSEAIVIVYSSNFSADELRAVTAFYKTPAGQKFLQKAPALMQQSMTAGQKFGQSVAADMKARMIEELRKKGHTL